VTTKLFFPNSYQLLFKVGRLSTFLYNKGGVYKDAGWFTVPFISHERTHDSF